MGPLGTGALQRSRKSAAGCLTAFSSSRTCGFACAYVSISVPISSLDLPLRPVKKAFTSGWLNRYDDVPAFGALGPPPRTVPWAHTVAAPALVQSAEAGEADMTLTGTTVRARPKIR